MPPSIKACHIEGLMKVINLGINLANTGSRKKKEKHCPEFVFGCNLKVRCNIRNWFALFRVKQWWQDTLRRCAFTPVARLQSIATISQPCSSPFNNNENTSLYAHFLARIIRMGHKNPSYWSASIANYADEGTCILCYRQISILWPYLHNTIG